MKTKNQKPKMNLGVGIALGVAFGVVFNNIALGIALGLVFGLALSDKDKEPEDSTENTL